MRRLPREVAKRVAVLVLAAGLVIAGATLVPGLLAGAPTTTATAELPEYNVSSVVPDRLPANGTVRVTDREDRGTVLIDDAHRNRFTRDELEPFTSAIAAAGYEVEFMTADRQMADALSRADAFVIVDPATSYSEAQIDRLEWFVDSGGRVLMLGEPTRSVITSGLFGSRIETVRNRLDPIAARFGIDFGETYLFNIRTNDGNYRNVLANATGGSLSAGVDRVATYTATHVSAPGGSRVLLSVDGTRQARGDVPGTYPIAVRNGNVLAVGDASFLEEGNYQVLDNEVFVGNVVDFLVSADPERTVLDYPEALPKTATIRYTSRGLLGAAQTLGADLRAAGGTPHLRLDRSGGSPATTDVLITTFDRLAELQGLRTGITVRDGQVAFEGYRGLTRNLSVIHTPRRGIDLVIVADTPGHARHAANALVRGTAFRRAISNSTVVFRGIPR